MPCMGFETTIPASKRTKTIHALDHSATVTGLAPISRHYFTTIAVKIGVQSEQQSSLKRQIPCMVPSEYGDISNIRHVF
jgi:hypothetical protein